MWTVGPLGFTAPLLLVAMVALPILWLILRAVPPAPVRRRFPGVALLLGLSDDETQTDRTPWWLLLLRMLAVAAVIIAFAGPVLNPQDERQGAGPLLILLDGTWADARDWPRRQDRVEALLDEASRAGRTAAVLSLTDLPAEGAPFQAAASWLSQLAGVRPQAWAPDAEAVADWAEGLDGDFDTFWMSDGLARPSRADLLAALEAHGEVVVFEDPRPVLGLAPARFDDGAIVVSAVRSAAEGSQAAEVVAHGLDPQGTPRDLSRVSLEFAEGESEAEVRLSLPAELRNRITRFELAGIRSAGAVALTDDALRRREVALIAATADREGLELLSPTHYIEQALEPTADLITGAIDDVLLANPDVVVLADVARVDASGALLDWVEEGGLLLRFAGPRLAASEVSRADEDPLLPVRLRAGGRSVGGAMSWGEPKALRPFDEDSPFHGLVVPEEVRVNAQVMAQPDPSLAERVIASLADGTPLVTRKRVGEGQVVLFHVTANAEWSTLPLSGLFVEMLERLAVSTRPSQPSADELVGTTWTVDQVLTAFGEVEEAGTRPGVPGETLAEAEPGPETPPGLYAGEDRRIALNVIHDETELAQAAWPERITVEGLEVLRERPLKGWFLAAALALLMLDILASLWLSGRLRGSTATAALALAIVPGLDGAAHAAVAGQAAVWAPSASLLLVSALLIRVPVMAAALAIVAALAPPAAAQDDEAIEATSEVVLAHVITGDAHVDQVAEAGLRGLSRTLFSRTSVEPAEPIAVDLENDELAFYPMLYWPVTADQPKPSDEAYDKLNRYLRTGGLILFDTRDADVAGFGGATPAGRRLQALAAPLDIPPLEPLPSDHVLTRSFYLLQAFPGRHVGRDVWVEAAPPDAELVDGMPFRNLNDNVTPVVIGGNDWAAAWAIDERGGPMFPVGRGYAGERQREIAMRFGVNLIMHVLTGNYKSDQVHVPALLDRLGQ
ncbi:DUF4159 domain-containing protein [Roseitranquillus sediminis]|uniref:DUF4159 domain-containing protein n=1 Tax=Roseitranquillus sediminis TaxID=2809051 RepID=UPI001D0C5BF3|nr:DUF4159 domain-containing protein [Roseitranquillus sediminis]MBM9594845.1 DUF4159 domain-containing protein [Roseitranquillus sediminis]